MAASTSVAAPPTCGKGSASKDLIAALADAATGSTGAGSNAGEGGAEGFTAALAALSTPATPIKTSGTGSPVAEGADAPAAAGAQTPSTTAAAASLCPALIQLARLALSTAPATALSGLPRDLGSPLTTSGIAPPGTPPPDPLPGIAPLHTALPGTLQPGAPGTVPAQEAAASLTARVLFAARGDTTAGHLITKPGAPSDRSAVTSSPVGPGTLLTRGSATDDSPPSDAAREGQPTPQTATAPTGSATFAPVTTTSVPQAVSAVAPAVAVPATAPSVTTGLSRPADGKISGRAHARESKAHSGQSIAAASPVAAPPATAGLAMPAAGMLPGTPTSVPTVPWMPAAVDSATASEAGDDRDDERAAMVAAGSTPTTPASDAPSRVTSALASAADATSAAAGGVSTDTPSGVAHSLDAARIAGSAIADGRATSPMTVMTANSSAAPAASSTGAAPSSTALERFIGTPVTSHEWGRAVAAEVHVLAANGAKEATLRLSPEHLGPVEVRIDVQDTKVNVSFTAAHAETRSALEQSVPQLRDLFAGTGLSLGQANVQQETRSGSHNFVRRAEQTFAGEAEEQPVITALGLVDEYA
jgi:flagellar hook-length control protein FliK